MTTPAEIQRIYKEAEQLYEVNEVEAAIKKMSEDITKVFSDKNPIVLCLMKGAIVVVGKLLPLLDFPLQLEYAQINRYYDTLQGGTPSWKKKLPDTIQRRHILIVDDILDEGVTLAMTIDACRTMEAKTVSVAVLVNKKTPGAFQQADLITGLTAPDRYLFGYGMDYKGYLRNAPGIFAINDHG